MDNNIIGKYIEKKRKSKGLTQKELAKRLGLSNTAISKWECGCNLPDVSMLEPLSKELGVDVSKLVALQSGHVNYQSLDELEEPEDSSPANEIPEYSNHNKTSSKKIILLSIIILSILTITSIIIFINISHRNKIEQSNANEVKVYKIISDDPDFSISGYVIYNHENNIILINKIVSQQPTRGTSADPIVKMVNIYLLIDEQIVFKTNIEIDSDKKTKLSESFSKNEKKKYNEDASEVNIYELKEFFYTSKVRIEYLTEDDKKENIDVKITLKEAFI